jgi:hypothetical protein
MLRYARTETDNRALEKKLDGLTERTTRRER